MTCLAASVSGAALAQDAADRSIGFGGHEPVDECIARAPHASGAVHQIGCEASILGRERGRTEHLAEQKVGVGTFVVDAPERLVEMSARDRAASQIEGLDAALDDLMSNRFVMGEHQASVVVYGDTPRRLADHLARARAILADSGLVVAREDLGLEAAFWAQFPGNFALRLRPAAITSRNFASFAPFHTHPHGQPDGNHWGPAVTTLRTSAGSPYAFNFHVGRSEEHTSELQSH